MVQALDPILIPDHPPLRTFSSASGARIFQLPVELFPGFWGYTYLVLVSAPDGTPMRVLIDCGSGFGNSNAHLEAGLAAVSAATGLATLFEDLTHILITHGHIDHFGGLSHIRQFTAAKIGIHELDQRILTNYEERLAMATRKLDAFFIEAGVSPERRASLLDIYRIHKALFHSVRVDFTYESCGMQVGSIQLLHVPGHCAGHVVMRLDDVLFAGDHVLEGLSPHQAPEQITLSTGLEHYLKSLETLRPLAPDITLTLGGHHDLIYDLEQRINEIKALHQQRLTQVLEILIQPGTVSDVSRALFHDVSGYTVLLAIEEAGAHVEYLYQRGLLAIHNLAEVENNPEPVPIIYRSVFTETQ